MDVDVEETADAARVLRVLAARVDTQKRRNRSVFARPRAPTQVYLETWRKARRRAHGAMQRKKTRILVDAYTLSREDYIHLIALQLMLHVLPIPEETANDLAAPLPLDTVRDDDVAAFLVEVHELCRRAATAEKLRQFRRSKRAGLADFFFFFRQVKLWVLQLRPSGAVTREEDAPTATTTRRTTQRRQSLDHANAHVAASAAATPPKRRKRPRVFQPLPLPPPPAAAAVVYGSATSSSSFAADTIERFFTERVPVIAAHTTTAAASAVPAERDSARDPPRESARAREPAREPAPRATLHTNRRGLSYGLPNLAQSCYINSALQALASVRDRIDATSALRILLDRLDDFSFAHLDKDTQQDALTQLLSNVGLNFKEQEDVSIAFRTFLEDTTTKEPIDSVALRGVNVVTSFPSNPAREFTAPDGLRDIMEDELQAALNPPGRETSAPLAHRLRQGLRQHVTDDPTAERTEVVVVQRWPPVLLVCLKRILFVRGRGAEKTEEEVPVADTLSTQDIQYSHAVANTDLRFVHVRFAKSVTYTLRAAVVHGGSARGGHYRAYVRHDDRFWSEYNDSVVRDFTTVGAIAGIKREMSRQAYYYVYERNE